MQNNCFRKRELTIHNIEKSQDFKELASRNGSQAVGALIGLIRLTKRV